MAATPNDFAYFEGGEPARGQMGVSSSFGFDYFHQGEPLSDLADVAAAPPPPTTRRTLPLLGVA